MASPRRKLTSNPASTPALGVGTEEAPRPTPVAKAVPAAKARTKDLNFKVPEDFKDRFADSAHKAKITRVDLLKRLFEAYEKGDLAI